MNETREHGHGCKCEDCLDRARAAASEVPALRRERDEARDEVARLRLALDRVRRDRRPFEMGADMSDQTARAVLRWVETIAEAAYAIHRPPGAPPDWPALSNAKAVPDVIHRAIECADPGQAFPHQRPACGATHMAAVAVNGGAVTCPACLALKEAT